MSKLKNCFLFILALCAAGLMGITTGCQADSDSDRSYHFLVAGHTYGSHGGSNIGLYPKFLEHLQSLGENSPDFLVLTGDIVRNPTQDAWTTALSQLDNLKTPYYMIMGNHDVSQDGLKVFTEKYGDTFYSMTRRSEKYIFLDTQRKWGRVSPEQIEFLKSELKDLAETRNVFIFIHELIWTAQKPKYRKVQHNFGSYNRKFQSNFWGDVYPLLESLTDQQIFIVAGDVGGNPGVLPAFYEQLGHVTLIASGMGEVRDENYLRVDVKNGDVSLSLIPLNEDNRLRPLTEYSLPHL